jgi:hypothetical protein
MKLLLAASLLLSSSLSISALAADEPPLTLTITGPKTVTVGDPIVIRSFVKNVSNRKVGFEFGHWFSMAVIYDEYSIEITPDTRDWSGSTHVLGILPGETKEDSSRIESLYPFVPGKYGLQFVGHVDPNDPNSPIIRSNEITITVLRRKIAYNKGTTPFSISISVAPNSVSGDPNVVKVGQQLVMNIVLTNLSDQPIDAPSAWMGGYDAVYYAEIRDPAGAQLTWAPPPTVLFLVPESGTLGPGKTKNEQIPINEYFDFTKPGTYEIQVKRCIDLENPVGQNAPKYDLSKGEVRSNKITITVVPKSTTDPQ